jgi:hypothetical protein
MPCGDAVLSIPVQDGHECRVRMIAMLEYTLTSPNHVLPSILSPVQPTSTIHTPLGLLTNILPAEPTFDLLLDDIIATAS